MGFGCPSELGCEERVQRVQARQLRLVEEGESVARGMHPSSEPGRCEPEGDGEAEGSLGAYVRALCPGSSCFCCGGELVVRRITGRARLLVCPSCGSEVERIGGE